MKKNITINLCGRLFQIDEDAYELLQQYINSLRSSFGKQEGGDEIVDDIENRIAELFDELRQQGIEAITIEHVKEIISTIATAPTGRRKPAQQDRRYTRMYVLVPLEKNCIATPRIRCWQVSCRVLPYIPIPTLLSGDS